MEYRKALERAVIYIENHLSEDIRVEDVAREAGYSYYHLTRQFTAVLGESVGNYIKKRRLSEAAKQLLYTDRRIIDIAVEYGFESSEAFSRAFKIVYHISPTVYRRNRIDLFISTKPQMTQQRMNHLIRNVTPHPRITELPDIKVAGLRGKTTLNDNILPQLWIEFNSMVSSIPDKKPGGRGFGVCEACLEGNTLYSMGSGILFSEVVAVEVTSFSQLPKSLTAKTLKAGRYAVFTHSGSLSKLLQTFEYIWGTWFLITEEQLDNREDFELYDERFLGYNHPDSQVDIYIPIR